MFSFFIYTIKTIQSWKQEFNWRIQVDLYKIRNLLWMFYIGISFKIQNNCFPEHWWTHTLLFDFEYDLTEFSANIYLASLWCLYCELWTYFILFSIVCIVDFEQVNADYRLRFWPETCSNEHVSLSARSYWYRTWFFRLC